MAKTYGDIRKSTLNILDEIETTGGTIQTTADVISKIKIFTNDAYEELSKTVDKVPETYTITRDAETDDYEFDLPADWFEKNYAMISRDGGEYKYFSSALYTIHADRKLVVSKYLYPVVVKFYYWKHITPLTFTGVEATDDALTLEISDMGVRVIPYYVAANILINEDTEKSNMNMAQYQQKVRLIKPIDQSISGGIISVTGW